MRYILFLFILALIVCCYAKYEIKINLEKGGISFGNREITFDSKFRDSWVYMTKLTKENIGNMNCLQRVTINMEKGEQGLDYFLLREKFAQFGGRGVHVFVEGSCSDSEYDDWMNTKFGLKTNFQKAANYKNGKVFHSLETSEIHQQEQFDDLLKMIGFSAFEVVGIQALMEKKGNFFEKRFTELLNVNNIVNIRLDDRFKLILIREKEETEIKLEGEKLLEKKMEIRKVVPKAFVERRMEGNGFHREIITNVLISNMEEIERDLGKCEYKMKITEKLPSSVFVDPFQLSEISRFGGPKYETYGEIDLEKPSYSSSSCFLTISATFNPNSTFSLPIHFRYLPPSHRPYTQVFIPSPEIVLYCGKEEHPVYFESEGTRDLSAILPNGLIQHALVVEVLTFSVPIIGLVFIVYFLLSKKKQKKN